MPKLIVTRPSEDAAELVTRLAVLGVEAILSPVMEIVSLPGPALDLSGVQGLLATSANGVRALAARTGNRSLVLYAVGDATARAAADAGFASVESASGDVDDLARLVQAKAVPGRGALLHVAATDRAGDLKGALEAAGFDVRREILYEARPVEKLSDDAARAIASGTCDGVLVYSPRSAKLFEKLAADAGLSATLSALDAICLSANVAAALKGSWRRKIVAEKPARESLLDAVATCYH